MAIKIYIDTTMRIQVSNIKNLDGNDPTAVSEVSATTYDLNGTMIETADLQETGAGTGIYQGILDANAYKGNYKVDVRVVVMADGAKLTAQATVKPEYYPISC